MQVANSPLAFWDNCIERCTQIYNMTASDHFKISGSNPHTLTTAEDVDISSLCQYAWYDWCYYWEHPAHSPYNQEVLGRGLGPAKGKGNEMAQLTDVCHFGHFWLSYGRCAMSGSPMEWSEAAP